MSSEYDVVVLGGGIAGVSVAAHLAEHARVLLIEMEDQPGHHSTGRSAALFLLTYGNAAVRALTRAGRGFFYAPPSSFSTTPLVRPRPLMVTAREGQTATMEAFMGAIAPGDVVRELSATEAVALCPVLRPEGLARVAYSESPADIEVHELLQGYLRQYKARGGALRVGSGVTGLERRGGGWAVSTATETVRAGVVVNAAGAWAGAVGRMAGAQDIGLQPLKRTACLIQPPEGARSDAWPMLADVEDQFYLKPDAGLLLLSPADETPTDPCDAQADELDLAIAVDRIEQATTLQVRRITHRWAGLRSFVADRSPVAGFDPVQPGFFWHAGLGGFGIQTAPALSRLSAALVLGHAPPDDLLAHGVEAEALSPSRLSPKTVETEPAPLETLI